MKVAIVDLTSLLFYCCKNIRLVDVQDMLKKIIVTEGNEEPIEIRIVMDSHREDYQSLMQTLIALRKRINDDTKNSATVVLINGYHSEEARNLSDIVIINNLYQDYLSSLDEEREYICVTASTRFFSAMLYIQEHSGRKMKVYVPEDHPDIEQLRSVFNTETLPFAKDKKNVLDKMVLKQIFKIIYWSEENGWKAGFRTLVENCMEYGNIRRFDVVFMIRSLRYNELIELTTVESSDGDPYLAVLIKDNDGVQKLLADYNIDL